MTHGSCAHLLLTYCQLMCMHHMATVGFASITPADWVHYLIPGMTQRGSTRSSFSLWLLRLRNIRAHFRSVALRVHVWHSRLLANVQQTVVLADVQHTQVTLRWSFSTHKRRQSKPCTLAGLQSDCRRLDRVESRPAHLHRCWVSYSP